MIRLIDAAAVLNNPGFSFSGGGFLTTPLVVGELKDLRSRHLAENALSNSLLRLSEPSQGSLARVREIAAEHGFSRLSGADISLLALALDLKKQKRAFLLITDDYSVQNLCRLLRIRFDSVIRGKIQKTVSFRKRCSGCGKNFPEGFSRGQCPDCGSRITVVRESG
jgi:UPF0271 protein